MEKLDLIIKKIRIGVKINIINKKNTRIICNRIFYSISVKLLNNNKIEIHSKWNIGILGKLIFRKIYREKNVLYLKLKKELLDEGFILDELNLIS